MVTCVVNYIIDPYKLREFEEYARCWLPIVKRMGGVHHGYFLPSEGSNSRAMALFSFPNLAAYEAYRLASLNDSDCQAAFELEARNRSVVSYERTFMCPLLEHEIRE